MLHTFRVVKALKGNAIRQTRIRLGIKARPKVPILSRTVADILGFHSLICRRLVDLWPADLRLEGESVCEIGPGDCLAAAAFFVGKGARHVDLVEHQPPVANAKQLEVLTELKKMGFPLALDLITRDNHGHYALNPRYLTYCKVLMEEYRAENQHAFMFSHNVMEHVEDLESCFKSAYRALRPGGQMLHVVDLGGHGEFEDPLPPLDFQTYPDWLFDSMYPVNERCTRRFLVDYRRAVTQAGFKEVKIRSLRSVDPAYLEAIYPRLRPAARQQPKEDLSVIEFVLTAVK